jgi:SulP family sulfate permease
VRQIASEIADEMADAPAEHMLATVLVTLALSTALLGVALMLTGYWKLAGLVQYLPLPVVGGYLAFIGLYCLEAGISLMSGLQARRTRLDLT